MRNTILKGMVILLGLVGPALGADKKSFPDANVRLEQNATDGDFEVVFEVGGTHVGLATLEVVSPGKQKVIAFAAPTTAKALGIRTFVFESPEPKDLASLKAAYPEGVYTFRGTTVGGVELESKAELDYGLPATATLLHPKEGSAPSTEGLVIRWIPITSEAMIVEIEQEELEVAVKATLPGSATYFSVPGDFLLPGTEYKVSIGTVSDEGNISFVESSFTTADAP